MTRALSELYVLANCASHLAQYCHTYGGDTAELAALAQAHHTLSQRHCMIPPALALWHEQQGADHAAVNGQPAQIDANLTLRFCLPHSGNLSLMDAIVALTTLFDAKHPSFTLGGEQETFLSCEISQVERQSDFTIAAVVQLHAQWIETVPADCQDPLAFLNSRLQYRALATGQHVWTITRLLNATPL